MKTMETNKMGEYKTYDLPDYRLGIDDLKTTYLFHGASQGDETRTNNVNEYLSSDGWLRCVDRDIKVFTQEVIDRAVEERITYNNRYIADLKKSGKYGQIEKGGTITIQQFPEYDNPRKLNTVTESYRMEILDFSNTI